MQNTSKIPYQPNTLLKNFFIAGVNQKTLASKILDNKAFNIPPEVLFSMYQSKDRVSQYLQFVFPENVAVEYQSLEPKFYTFMTTDQDGFNSFIHVLTFYEEINEAEISSQDFDILTEILRKQHLSNNAKKEVRDVSQQREGSGSGNEANGINIYNQHRKKLKEMIKKRNEKCLCMNVAELSMLQDGKNIEEIPSNPNGTLDKLIGKKGEQHVKKKLDQKEKELTKKEKMEQMMQKINNFGCPNSNNLSGNQSIEYRTYSMQQETPLNGSTVPSYVKLLGEQANKKISSKNLPTEITATPMNSITNRPKSNAFKLRDDGRVTEMIKTEEAAKEESKLDESDNFTKATNFAAKRLKDVQYAMDDSFLIGKTINVPFGVTPIGRAGQHNEEPTMCIQDTETLEEDELLEFEKEYFRHHNLDFARQTSHFGIQPRKSNHLGILDSMAQLEKLYQKKRYVPVAICLETETEYHDVFRKILLAMFDEIRVPENVINNKIYENRRLAFAELVAHLAYLRTIPAPTFNSIYNVYLFNQVFTIKESMLDQLPNKNSYAIKILFDVLDVKSIFYCWKALLFDKTLVLVSSQYSLQFYIAEGLKQLLFPMTWQNTYIQPGNEHLAGHCDGTIVCLYGSNSMVNGFDFFDGMSPDMAVCDIDACYTNSIELPCVPDETMYIRILNTLKNSRINQYDKAYPDTHIPDSEDFVMQIRETFFGLLKPFLSRVEKYIDTTIEPQHAYFHRYFDQVRYLDDYRDYGETHFQFARQLLLSSQFVHFCDDYFNDELNNYKMLQHIYKSRGEIQESDGTDRKSKPQMRPNVMSSISPDDLKHLNDKEAWPDQEPIVFNFRMPQDNQRFMLFENILHMIEDSLEKREADVSRQTNEHIMQNKESLMYEKIITDIKRMYPIKLKGLHKMYEQQDQKMLAVNQMKMNQTLDGQKGLQKLPTMFRYKEVRANRQARISLDSQAIDSPGSSFYRNPRLSIKDSEIKPVGFYPYQNGNGLNSSNRIPLDQLNNSNYQSQEQSKTITGTLIDNNFLGEELQRIQQCERRISKLMYGKQGLMTFLHHLFGLLNEDQMKRVNYYFSMSNQVEQMLQTTKQQKQNLMDLRANNPIVEEVNEDDYSSSSKQPSLYNRNRTKTDMYQSTLKDQLKSPSSTQAFEAFQIQRAMTNMKSIITSNGSQSYAQSKISQTFKQPNQWFSISQWETKGNLIKKTQQFILMKIKLFETFECPYDGYSLIWNELLKFPANKMEFFPQSKFMHIWETLTLSQQQEQFVKLGQKMRKPQVRMICQDFVKLQNAHTMSMISQSTQDTFQPKKNGPKNDESIFSDSCIEKSYIVRREEKKQKELLHKQKHPTPSYAQYYDGPAPQTNNDIPKKKDAGGTSSRSTKPSDKLSHVSTVPNMIKQKLELRKQLQSSSSSLSNRGDSKDKKSSSSKSRNGQSLIRDSDIFVQAKMTEYGTSLSTFKTLDNQKSTSILQKQESASFASVDFELGKRTMGTMATTVTQSNLPPLKEPENFSQNLLSKVIKFWQTNSEFVQKKGQFKESELTRIQQELHSFSKYLKHLKQTMPELCTESIKQAFFLNLFNFLVLYHMALHMFSNPEAIEQLKNYNMWQAFLIHSILKLGGHTLSAYSILHSILRHSLPHPRAKIGAFILDTPAIEFQCQQFQVKDPHPLLCFGVYLPLKKMPWLKVFSSKDLDCQLKARARAFLTKKLRVKEHHRILILPKFLYWYSPDFRGGSLVGTLKFIHERVFDSEPDSRLAKFLKNVDSGQIPESQLLVTYSDFCWMFHPSYLAKKFTNAFHELPMKAPLILNQLVNVVIAIILVIELWETQGPYVWSYLGAELAGLSVSLFAFKIAPNLLTMSRSRRKWVLQMVYTVQMAVFLAHLLVSIGLWINFKLIAHLIATNEISYLSSVDAFLNVAIYLGFTTLLLGLDVYMTIYFRKFLGREQIRVEDKKKRLREMNLYQDAVQHLYQELMQQETSEFQQRSKHHKTRNL